MPFELRELAMFIFKNENRDVERNQATHQGNTKVDGKEYYVNCWVKEGKNGKFFSCTLTLKEQKPAPAEDTMNVGDDEIPF